MLLTFFFGLLHLLVGVCGTDGADGDLPNLKAIFYTNPYPIAKPYNCKVIATLAAQGQCMSYMGIEETPLESLASCELYCYEAHYANTWDVSTPFPLVLGGHASILIHRGMASLAGLKMLGR